MARAGERPDCGPRLVAAVPEVEQRDALVRLAAVVAARADDEVAIAVSVYVSGGCDRVAEVGARLVGLRGPVRTRGEAARRPEIQVGAAFIDLTVVVVRPDDDVAVAVPVDVAGRCHGDPKEAVGLVRLRGPGLGGLRAQRGAEEQVRPPLADRGVVVVVRADEHVAKAVAVHVARRSDRHAEVAVAWSDSACQMGEGAKPPADPR